MSTVSPGGSGLGLRAGLRVRGLRVQPLALLIRVISFGATEQNILKLFERIIDDPALTVPVLTQSQLRDITVIY